MLMLRLPVRPADLEHGRDAVGRPHRYDEGGLAMPGRTVDAQLPLGQQVPEQARQAVEPGGPLLGAAGELEEGGRDRDRHYFFGLSDEVSPVLRAAMKASWGTSTRPTIFIRFLPSFCFSSSFRFRVMSPP
jgi:hypothetical protein